MIYCDAPSTIIEDNPGDNNLNAIALEDSLWDLESVFRLEISLNDGYDWIGTSANYSLLASPTGLFFVCFLSTFECGLRVANACIVTGLSPVLGPKSGGTLVGFEGTNFGGLNLDWLFCKFGAIRQVKAISKGSTSLNCLSPQSSALGSVAVSLVYREEEIYSSNSLAVFPFLPSPLLCSFLLIFHLAQNTTVRVPQRPNYQRC